MSALGLDDVGWYACAYQLGSRSIGVASWSYQGVRQGPGLVLAHRSGPPYLCRYRVVKCCSGRRLCGVVGAPRSRCTEAVNV